MRFLKNNKNLSKISILVISALLIWSVFLLVAYFSKSAAMKTMTVGDNELKVEIARTLEQKAAGLSQRESLAKERGMLFIYDNYLIPKYWMKDMIFSIDIIWIKDNMVVGYEKNLPLRTGSFDLPIYQPKTFINYVLEVNAGWVDKHEVKIGDKVNINI